MEKQIRVAARYHFSKNDYVEVRTEVAETEERDYWLCKNNSVKKRYLFSSRYVNQKSEENLIRREVKKYLAAMA